jgi:hypothetical protein
MKKSITLLASVCFITSIEAQNLVINGHFDDSLSGWNQLPGSYEGSPAEDDWSWADYLGGVAFQKDDDLTGGSIQQTIAFTPGQNYELFMGIGNTTGDLPGDVLSISVVDSFSGSDWFTPVVITNTWDTGVGGLLVPLNFNFTAAGTSGILRITNVSPNSGLDTAVDNVSIVAVVPEPSTLLLGLLGFVGLVLHRKRG